MRHSVASNPTDADLRLFAEDVAYYLSLTPRQLPSRYFYDGLGSALFEAICELPWYGIARTERQLLSDHASDIFGRLNPISRVVELGPGSGDKLATLMAAHAQRDVTVHLVDVSRAALDGAARALAHYPEIVVVPHQATYEKGLLEIQTPASAGKTLMLFLGSNIGNFDPPGANAFLRNVRAALVVGDALLLGTDLVKPERDLLLAYDDPLGVTAAFNRNLLVRLNRELGSDFNVEHFAHSAVWNPGASRIEMHLVSKTRQRVRVPPSHLDIAIDAGETIWTESSYKYHAPEVRAMLDRADFSVIGQWTHDGFALTLAEAR